jgi:hypothetical protein
MGGPGLQISEESQIRGRREGRVEGMGASPAATRRRNLADHYAWHNEGRGTIIVHRNNG